jgi:hypothetical protein
MIRLIGCMPLGFIANWVLAVYAGPEAFQIWLCGWVIAVTANIIVRALKCHTK